MRNEVITDLEYDLEQIERQLAQWRRKMRYEDSQSMGQTTSHSMFEYYRREVERMKIQLHALRTQQS